MSTTFDFEALLNSADDADKLPPLHLWQPPYSGEIDIRIDRQGSWFHEGEPFLRLEIPKLFSRILVREGEEYFLKTPVEKWRIHVEDVPFSIVGMQHSGTAEEQQITFISSTEDVIKLDAQHPLRVEIDSASQEPSPYVAVRDGMEAKLCRSVFYQLVELADLDDSEQQLEVKSGGQRFVLGRI